MAPLILTQPYTSRCHRDFVLKIGIRSVASCSHLYVCLLNANSRLSSTSQCAGSSCEPLRGAVLFFCSPNSRLNAGSLNPS